VVIFGNDVRVSGNRIGTNVAGDAAIPNEVGLDVRGTNHTIGGDGPGQGNLISGNIKGIWIQGEFITVRQNRIGTDAAGAAAVPNGVGILVEGPGNVAIGGPSPALGNLVAFNRLNGLFIARPRQLNILNNRIHSNGQDGIFVFRGQDMRIESNTIFSNGDAGVRLGAPGTRWFEETVQRTTISRNSFYDNGGRAILFTLSFVNGDILPPSLTSVSRTSAAGTACPGCVVEIFLAARDPSGFGEGKTFLTSVTAGADGAYHATLPEVRNCESLTATATDADGNTSAFAQNQTVGVCVVPPSLYPHPDRPRGDRPRRLSLHAGSPAGATATARRPAAAAGRPAGAGGGRRRPLDHRLGPGQRPGAADGGAHSALQRLPERKPHPASVQRSV
jgi:parallel beta-helix repeat protein